MHLSGCFQDFSVPTMRIVFTKVSAQTLIGNVIIHRHKIDIVASFDNLRAWPDVSVDLGALDLRHVL